jgi:DNA repair exonuclease SbcCD nuclease subunit
LRPQEIILTSPNPKPDLKFIHFADTHLGSNWPAIGRREQIQVPIYGQAFANVVEAALTHHVDFVLHGGDFVDRPRAPTVAWNRILQELPKLKEAGIPFIVTPGSHDEPESYFDRAGGDVLDVLDRRLGLVKRVDMGRQPTFSFETSSGKRVIVYGLGDHGAEQEAELQKLKMVMHEGPEFKVLLMHSSVSNMPHFAGPTVKSDKIEGLLSARYVDYVALGHNHRRWQDPQLEVYNPGSPEITSFADAPTIGYHLSHDGTLEEDSREIVEHGYYLVEVHGEIINAQFIPLQTRDVKNIQIHYENATADQVTSAAKQAISNNLTERAIIRPVFTGRMNPSSSRTEIDLAKILTLKQKVLYLAYPLLNFEQPMNQLQYSQTSELSAILEQYFTPLVGDAAQETARLAMKILKVYEKRTQTANQEALEIVDQWKRPQ